MQELKLIIDGKETVFVPKEEAKKDGIRKWYSITS
jgi:hypothetical protein